MRNTWAIGSDKPPLPDGSGWHNDWKDKEVVLQFNGPQLTVAQSNGIEYLSVASDEDSRAVRWLRSPISSTEKSALFLGCTTVLDCILKPEIWVVDTDGNGAVINEVKVSPEELSWADLPSPDSCLPIEIISAQKAMLPPIARPSIVIDGLGVSKTAALSLLADVFQSLQRLWTSIAQAVSDDQWGPVQRTIVQRSEILLANVFPSSFGLAVDSTDNHLFQKIGEQYRNLVLASSDKEKLRSLVAALKSPVRAAYSDYLEKLQKHSVEIFTRWGDGGAFISPSTAARVEPILAFTESEDDVVLKLQGYFRGYNLKTKKFLFVSTTEEEYGGDISREVLRDPMVRITISSAVSYDAQIVMSTTVAVGSAPRHKYRLAKIFQHA